MDERINRAAETLRELVEQIEQCKEQRTKELLQRLADELAEEIAEAVHDWKEDKTVEGMTVGQYVTTVQPVIEILRKYVEAKEGKYTAISGLPADIQQEIEDILKNPNESGLAYINDSPVMKKIVRPKEQSKQREEISLSGRETAVFTLLEGYADPYEGEMLQAISKFKMDGQVTQNGKIFCTVGQIYRGMRHGGRQSPTEDQRADIMNTLREMAKDERKISFVIDDYLKVWGGFETNGGRLRMISYDEFYGKIRGQNDTLILFDDTPVLCAISERLRMYETVSQEVKGIQEEIYTLTADTGEIIKGNVSQVKRKLKKLKLSDENIVQCEIQLRNWSLSKDRIALRYVLFGFVFSYIRARTAGKPHSNKITYNHIFSVCGVNENYRSVVSRRKADIATILDHLKRKEVIVNWKEYTNRGSKKPDGIQITVAKEVIGG